MILSVLTKGKMAKKISKARPDKKPSMAPFTNALSSSTEKERETGKVPKKTRTRE